MRFYRIKGSAVVPAFHSFGLWSGIVAVTTVDKLMDRIHDHNTEAFRTGGVMIAGGMARFGDDACVASVFDRADQSMYGNKKALKDVGNML